MTRQRHIRENVESLQIGVFGIAAVGSALPAIVNLAPITYNYFSTAVQAQMSERIASASSEAIMQYAGNIPKFGFGLRNVQNMNVSSIGLNFAAPGSNLISAVGGSGLELNFADGYQGLGSGEKSFKTFMFQSAIGTGGNYMGNKLGGLFGKYSNAGSFLNTFTGDALGNGTANTVQTISDEVNKKDEKPK